MMKILIVEDDADFAQTLCDLLEMEECDVDVVAEAAAADALLAPGHPYDAAVFDLNLKDGNSIRLLQDLQERDPALRKVAITGGGKIQADVGMPLATIHGAQAVLFKPFENNEFLDAVLGTTR